MRDQRLLDYYERELTFLRQLGSEFADSYGAVASRLRMEPNRTEDPHVERLLQGFAFLAARIHLKVDDGSPEISQALLNVVYPHYLRPVPAMGLVQFRLDPERGKLSSGWPIPRHSKLVTPPTKSGVRCRFRTCYDTTLLPLTVASAGWHSPHEVELPEPTDSFAILRVELQGEPDVTFDELEFSELRFYLDGDPGVVASLYELLCNNCTRVVAWNPADKNGRRVSLPGSALCPVGFEPDEAMLPATRRSFLPYQMIQEYFAFPRKYHFLDVKGLEGVRSAGVGNTLQLLFFISRFEQPDRHARLQEAVSERTLRLGCTPIVNLFPLESRPIRMTQRQSTYPVKVTNDAEVFSIEEVFAVAPGATERIPFAPFYAVRHSDQKSEGLFWASSREPSSWEADTMSDVSLAFVDMTGETVHPEYHSVTVRTLCSNGNLPNELPFGSAKSDFALEEGNAPIQGIHSLVTPTKAVPPHASGQQLWRLISMLSLNYLSLVDHGADAFKDVLRLYDFSNSNSGERHIDGIVGIKSEPMHAPFHGEHGLSFARGRSVSIEFDEDNFTGGSVYLFASVIERFLGLYSSLNSFSRLVATIRQRPGVLRAWPPRSGLKPLL